MSEIRARMRDKGQYIGYRVTQALRTRITYQRTLLFYQRKNLLLIFLRKIEWEKQTKNN